MNISLYNYSSKNDNNTHNNQTNLFDLLQINNNTLLLFAYMSLAIVSFTGNTTSFHIFSTQYFRSKNLYAYLKLMCANSTALNILLCLTHISNHIGNEWPYWQRILAVYLIHPLTNTLDLFGRLLDTLLVIERLFQLTTKHKCANNFEKKSPKKLSLCLLLACFFFNFSLFLLFEPKIPIIFNSNIVSSSFYTNRTLFDVTITRRGQYFTRNVLNLIVLCVASGVLFVVYARVNFNSVHRLSREIPMKPLLGGSGGSGEKRSSSLTAYFFLNRGSERLSSLETIRRNASQRSFYEGNQILIRMVYVMSVFAISIESAWLVGSFVVWVNNKGGDENWDDLVLVVGSVGLHLKHALNVLVFYVANPIFRKHLKRIVCCRGQE